MKKQSLGLILVSLLLAGFSITCSLLSGITNRYGEAKGTAQSVATDVEQGQQYLNTAKAIATEMGDSNFMSTAKALATEAKDSGLLETAQAFITAEGPEALETMQAFATEQGPSIMETGQAIATQMGEGNYDQPTDIPVVSGDKEMFFSSAELISYFTSMNFQDVLQFYKNEMPNNGWTRYEEGWVENTNSAVIYYEKPDQLVSITLSINPIDEKTIVMITIHPK